MKHTSYFLTLLTLYILTISLNSANYYWVGGSGNWSSINNWATTSGGSSKHLVVPGPNDDVYFDHNSGFTAGNNTVTLDAPIQNCKNLIFTNAGSCHVIQNNTNNILNIFGSLDLNPLMIFDVREVFFKSNNSGEHIKTHGIIIGVSGAINAVIFDGDGEWNLLDDFTIGSNNPLQALGSMELLKGTIKTNGHTLNIPSFKSASSSNRNLDLGASTINIFHSNGWRYTGTGAVLNAGTSLINLTANFNSSNGGLYANSSHTYYHVLFSSNLSTSAQISGGGQFQKVTFNGGGMFNGNNTFDSLFFSSGKKYLVTSNTTQTIEKLWSAASPSCHSLIELSSSHAAAATIHINPSCTANISGVAISNMVVTGNIPLITTNTYDLGDNSGISFNSGIGNTLYWVGGSGSWNDKNHWSLNNDGVFPSSSGGCTPTPIDNVVFNSNSGFSGLGQTVTLDETNQYCKNMTWNGATNTPTISSLSSSRLSIFGSLELQTLMNYQVLATYFKSDSIGETIKTNGTIMYNSNNGSSLLSFNGLGEWTLLDDLQFGSNSSTIGSVELFKGTLNTNSHRLNIPDFKSLTTYTRNLILGASQITVRGVNGWKYSGLNSMLDAGTSNIDLTFTFNSLTGGMETYHNHHYYHIIFSSSPSVGAVLSGSGIAQKIIFNGSGYFHGNNTIDTLILSSGKKYQFTSGTTQTIKKLWQALSPACDALIELSSSNTSNAIIHTDPACVSSLSGVAISGITALGNIPIITNNSYDLSNNNGFLFNTGSGKTLYWVGGTGNWNDKTHWSLNNDGLYPSNSGGCVPTPIDDVIFNANSGFTAPSQKITLDAGEQYCKNMLWTGVPFTPTISGLTTNSLNIFGSLELQPLMKYDIAVTMFKSNSMGQTIKTNGIILYEANNISSLLKFDGDGGWILLDDLQFGSLMFRTGTFELTKGSLNTNNHKLNIPSFRSSSSLNRDLVLGNSEITVRGVNGWEYSGNNSILNAGNSQINITSTFSTTSSGVLTSASHTYNNITFTNPTSTSAAFRGSGTAKKVIFNGGGYINGNNKFDTLVFAAGKKYVFSFNTTQEIHKAFYPNGNPCNVTEILSSNNSSPAYIKVLSGNINYNFINIKNINATGSYGTWSLAAQSFDAGGNTGMTFAPYDPAATIDGFGNPDQHLDCVIDTLLNANSFYPSPLTELLWNDGSTKDTLRVTRPGTYTLHVTYAPGCTVSDAVTFTFDDTCSAFLPIILSEFSVKNTLCSNRIIWSTNAEINNDYFEVYRSTNGVNWLKIASKKGAGNSNSNLEYEYIDNDILQNETYYYHLTQVDFNGRKESFPMEVVHTFSCEDEITIFPNPALDFINAKWNASRTSIDSYQIIDITGRIVENKTQMTNTGFEKINVANLSSGSYFIILKNNETIISSHKFIIIK